MIGHNVNSVLKDFLDMRRSLHKAPQSNPQPTTQMKQNEKVKRVGKTKEGQLSETLDVSVAQIIEDKPPKKEVCEYFQKECDKLTAQKMA